MLFQPAPTTFAVSATIAAQCVVGNTTSMAFGGLRMLNRATGGLDPESDYAEATFDAACTNGTNAPTLKFASQNGGTAFKLMGGMNSDLITYSLEVDSSGTTIAIAHDTFAAFPGFAADGSVKSLSVTGLIVAADKAGKTIGTYSDTVTITASFTP